MRSTFYHRLVLSLFLIISAITINAQIEISGVTSTGKYYDNEAMMFQVNNTSGSDLYNVSLFYYDYDIYNYVRIKDVDTLYTGSTSFYWNPPLKGDTFQVFLLVQDYIGNQGLSDTLTIVPGSYIRLDNPMDGSLIIPGYEFLIEGIKSNVDTLIFYYKLCSSCPEVYFSNNNPFSTSFNIWTSISDTINGIYPDASIIVKNNNGSIFHEKKVVISNSTQISYIEPKASSIWKSESSNPVSIFNGTGINSYGYVYLYDINGNYLNSSTYIDGVNLLESESYVSNNSYNNLQVYLSFFDYSTNQNYNSDTFTLEPASPTIQWITPNGGYFYKGDYRDISWLCNNANSTIISYSIDGGSSWTTIDTVNSNDGYQTYYQMYVPDLNGHFTDSRIKIAITNQPEIFVVSPPITISNIPPVIFTGPEPGTVLKAGSEVMLTFNSTEELQTGNFNLQYTNNGIDWNYLAYLPQVNFFNTVAVTIPELSDESNIKFRLIYYENNWGESPSYVIRNIPDSATFVNYFQAEQTFRWGGEVEFLWYSFGLRKVKIELFDNSKEPAEWIILKDTFRCVDYYNSILWKSMISSGTKSGFYVKITDLDRDSSSYIMPSFTLADSHISIVSPTSSDTFNAGDFITVTVKSNSPDYINEDLYINYGNKNEFLGNIFIEPFMEKSNNYLISRMASNTSEAFVYMGGNSITSAQSEKFTIKEGPAFIEIIDPYENSLLRPGMEYYLSGIGYKVDSLMLVYKLCGNCVEEYLTNIYLEGNNFYTAYSIPISIEGTYSDARIIVKKYDNSIADENKVIISNSTQVSFIEPNAGSIWKGKSYNNIKILNGTGSSYGYAYLYDVNGNINNVYSYLNGSNILESSMYTNNYSYDNMQVYVSFYDYYTSQYYNSDTFTLEPASPTIEWITPNGGYFYKGDYRNISWLSSNTNSTTISYSIDGGSSWTTIDTVNSNDGYQTYYQMYVPDLNGHFVDSRIKVAITNQPEIFVISPQITISNIPPITFISPKPDTVLTAGQYFNLVFNSVDSLGGNGYFSIEYSVNGSSWQFLNYFDFINYKNVLSVLVPYLFDKDNIQFQIKNYGNVLGVTDQFVVKGIYSPNLIIYNPGYWVINSENTLQVNADVRGIYQIYISSDAGNSWNLLKADELIEAGESSITISDTLLNQGNVSKNSLIKIVNTTRGITATSNVFTVSADLPTFSILQPFGGEVLKAGSTLNVVIDNNGPSGYASTYLNYGPKDTLLYSVYLKEIYLYEGRNNVNIILPENSEGSEFVSLSVRSYYGFQRETSSNLFTITELAPYITVIKPTTNFVQYTGNGLGIELKGVHVDQVKIDYSPDGGKNWMPVEGNYYFVNFLNNTYWIPYSLPDIYSEISLIKVTDISDSAIYDISEYFITSNKADTLNFFKPDQGITIKAGSNMNVEYEYTGRWRNYIDFYFSIDNGLTREYITSTSGNLWGRQNFNLTIPFDAPTTNEACVVAVFYVDSQQVNIKSKLFTIIENDPSISINDPNYNSYWISGNEYPIYWNSYKVDRVKIEYSTNSLDWVLLADSVYNYGYYYATAPSVQGTNFNTQIRISSVDNPTITGNSSLFILSNVSPWVEITSPLSNSVLKAGYQYNLSATYNGPESKFNLYLKEHVSQNSIYLNNFFLKSGINNFAFSLPNYLQASDSSSLILENTNYEDSYVWDTVPVKISASDPIIYVNSPNSSSYIVAGEPTRISFYAINTGDVIIEFSNNAGASWTTIDTFNTKNGDNEISWTPNETSEILPNCIIKVSSINSPNTFKNSDIFTITNVKPSLSIISPNSGEILKAGNSYYIEMDYNGPYSYMNYLYVSPNGGLTWNRENMIYNISNGKNYFLWTLPAYMEPSNLYKIKVVTENYIEDVSDSNFTVLKGEPQISISSPNANYGYLLSESWQWLNFYTANVNAVVIDMSLDGGTTWTTLNNNYYCVNGSNQYYFQLPKVIGINENAKLRIFNKADSSLVAYSDIMIADSPGTLSFVTPNDTTSWVAGDYVNVEFNMAGLSINSSIEFYIKYPDHSKHYVGWSYLNYGFNSIYLSLPVNLPGDTSVNLEGIYRTYDFANNYYTFESKSFAISAAKPSIAIYNPGNNAYLIGNKYNYISWNTTNVSSVNIEFSYNGGVSWDTIAKNYFCINGYNSFNYLFKDSTSNGKLRISSSDATGIIAISENITVYTGAVGLSLNSPNGGNTYRAGGYFDLDFNYTGDYSAVSVYISSADNIIWNQIETYYAYHGNNVYRIYIPLDVVPGNMILKIADEAGNFDISDSSFLVTGADPFISITKPNYGSVLLSNNIAEISWSSYKVDTINLWYSIDNQASWNNIVTGISTLENGKYFWNVPVVSGTKDAFIKISSKDEKTSTISEWFKISNVSTSFTIITPNGGDSIQAESNMEVKFDYSGTAAKNIELLVSINGGSIWENLNVSFVANPGTNSINVFVPYTLATNSALIRIQEKGNPSLYDISDNTFVITEAVKSITITSPTRGAFLVAGTAQRINWNSYNVNNVRIEYSTDSAQTWNLISEKQLSPNGTNTYSWTVPSVTKRTDNAFIKLSDGEYSVIGNNFTISQTTPSSNARLSSIYINDNLISGFVDTVYTYTYGVPYSTAVPPSIIGVPIDINAKLAVFNATSVPGTSYIDVIAEDGVTSKRYTVNFEKNSPSDDAYLSNITINNVSLPGFSSGAFTYNYTLPAYTKEIPVVAATATAENSLVVISQATSLSGTATIKVSSESGKLTNSYSIKFNLSPFNVIENTTYSISENPNTGTIVGKLNIKNWTDTRPLTFSITQGNDSGYYAVSKEGEISVVDTSGINYELASAHLLTIKAKVDDDSTKTDFVFVTINIQNVNEKPSLKEVNFSLNENVAKDYIIGHIEAIDPEAGTVSFAIVNGNQLGIFSLNALNGELKVNKPEYFNYELNKKLIITIKVEELSGEFLSDEIIVTIEINDLNEIPVISNHTFSISEDSNNGTLVGKVEGSDPDSSQVLSYSILSGNDDGIFGINQSTGDITILNDSLLDFEYNSSYILIIRARDNGVSPLGTTANVAIEVINVNEPPVISSTSFTIAENSTTGSTINTVKAIDPDAGSVLNYSIISGNENNAIALDPISGLLKVNNSAMFDFESRPVIYLVVSITDNGIPSLTTTDTISINLTDVNEAPAINEQTFFANENLANGSIVAKVIASDPDKGQALSYSIVFQSIQGVFSIDQSSGEILVANSLKLDYESFTNFLITVKVQDNGPTTLSKQANIKIYLNDLPEKAILANFVYSFGDNNLVIFTDSSSVNTNKWYWTFGDGSSFSGSTVSHTYKAAGLYNVCLTAVDENKGVSDKVCKDVQVGEPACIINADFSFGIDTTSVTFINESNGIDVSTYYWNFGDDKVSYLKDPIHTYSQSGYYLVSLTITDSAKKCSDYVSKMIQVGTVECIANFDYTVETKTVKFVNSSVGSIAIYNWDYGDGNYSMSKDASHTYAKDGLYRITLTVANATASCMDVISIPVIIGESGCGANFSYAVEEGTKKVEFTNQVIGTSTNLLWSFGDGRFSLEKNPVHTYSKPGYYNVSLNTFNLASGCMDYYESPISLGDVSLDCEAAFAYTIDTAKLSVQFVDKSKGNIKFYVWDYGDAIKEMKGSPVHTYNKAGYYNVCLTVINDADISNTSCQTIPVIRPKDIACYADFSYNMDNLRNVSFSDLSKGKPNKWEWDFGESNAKSAIQNPTHQYSANEYYLVSLKVANASGGKDKTYKLIPPLDNSSLFARFGYDIDSTSNKAGGYPVDFVGAGSGDQSRLRWDFGDGSSDTLSTTPQHNYAEPGSYYVCYEVSDPITGDKSEYCDSITISSGQVSVDNFIANASNLRVFPNPVKNLAQIEYSLKENTNVELVLFDFSGREIINFTKLSQIKGDYKMEWNVSTLDKGTYVLRMKTKSGYQMQMLIKQ